MHTTKPASPPVIVLHSVVTFESAAKTDDVSLTAVASSTSSAVFSFDAPFGVFGSIPSVVWAHWETRLEIKMPEQGTMKKAAKTRQPDQPVLVSTLVQLKCLGKRKKKTKKNKSCAVNTTPELFLILNCLERSTRPQITCRSLLKSLESHFSDKVSVNYSEGTRIRLCLSCRVSSTCPKLCGLSEM